MGNRESQLTKDELEDYKELTYLTGSEIHHAFRRFKNLDPRLKKDKFARVDADIIKKIPELQNNPFADRICEIFSFEGDDRWSFEDFLDMVSVFGAATPISTKAEYAFRIYDFDQDGFISKEDLSEMVSRLSGEDDLVEEELERLLEHVMEETDLGEDGLISFGEFEHAMMKCPDFASTFTIRM